MTQTEILTLLHTISVSASQDIPSIVRAIPLESYFLVLAHINGHIHSCVDMHYYRIAYNLCLAGALIVQAYKEATGEDLSQVAFKTDKPN